MIGLVPRTLDEALDFRVAHPEAAPVAGGTDLMVDVNAGRRRLEGVLDLSRLEELQGWERRSGTIFVGAGMTFARIARELTEFRPLVEAALSVGSPAIRNRATVGGNLATASPAGDGLPVLAVYGADVLLAAAGRRRRLPLEEFLTGPKRTALAPDELIVGVEWRPVDGPGRFVKVGIRNAMVIAIASACLQLDEGERRVRIALGSVAPTVLRARVAEAYADEALDWNDPTAALVDFGRLAAAETQPIDDVRGSAAYRRHAVEVLARRALLSALEERC
jgi:CO/xanthine dehydrogenase FAD-binding subunit